MQSCGCKSPPLLLFFLLYLALQRLRTGNISKSLYQPFVNSHAFENCAASFFRCQSSNPMLELDWRFLSDCFWILSSAFAFMCTAQHGRRTATAAGREDGFTHWVSDSEPCGTPPDNEIFLILPTSQAWPRSVVCKGRRNTWPKGAE